MGFFTIFAEISSISMFLVITLFLGLKKRDFRSVAQIVTGSFFGVTLEFFNVLLIESYNYSTQFLIQVGSPPGNIPIVIGLSWGLIIWACMGVSNRINLKEWSRPALDGLLALTIDLSMDTIAIRLDGGFWIWKDIPLDPFPSINGFFGVNYGNFVGWFLVVLIFSILMRLEQKIFQNRNSVAISIIYFCISPFLAYILLYISLSIVPFPIIFLFYNYVADHPEAPPQLILLLVLVYVLLFAIITQLIAIRKAKPQIQKDVDWILIFIFMSYHLIYIPFYFMAGLFIEAPLIFFLAFLMLIIDILIHWLIFDREIFRDQISKLILVK
ncbi:MAG: carotenoid biosynthesis protein [Candidatus Hodarchaeota archaeon]